MRQGHFCLIFVILGMICFLFLYLEQKQYDKAIDEKQTMEKALIVAMKDAGRAYEEVLKEPEEKRLQTLEQTFFHSWYVAAGAFGNQEVQKQLRMYLPMLVLAEEDGVFFFYMQEVQNGQTTELMHVWSKKLYYEGMEESTEAQKKNIVATVLENTASEIITRHNYIAAQYGVSYSFYVPDFLQDTSSALEFPMMYAVFQGWPLTASGAVTYDNCLDAGAYIQKVERFVVTGPEGLQRAGCFYHTRECRIIADRKLTVIEENVTRREAVLWYGALACENCVP